MKAFRLSWALALSVLAVGPALLAEPPAPSAAAPANSAGRRESVLQRLRERGLPLPSGSAALPLPSAMSAPSGSGAAPLPSAGGLRADLARKWRALAESRQERRARHRASLEVELGPRLADPAVQAALKLHATRVAELSRLRFLAEHSRSGEAREKLLARIDKLSEREKNRHRARMAQLLGARPLPSGRVVAPAGSASAGGNP